MKTKTVKCKMAFLLIGFSVSGSLLATVRTQDRTGLSSVPGSAETPEQQDLGNPAPFFKRLDRLVNEVLRLNPSIQAARKQWEASTKQPSQVSSLPNPDLTFESMSTANLLPYSTIGGGPLSWASFMFTQKIPWPGKLALKREIAEAEADQNAQRYRAVTLQVVRQLKEAYFDLHYNDRSTEILSSSRNLLEKFSKIAEARYSVGKGIQADVLRAQIEVSLIVERLEVLEGRRESVQARINSLLNRSPDMIIPKIDPIQKVAMELPFSLEKLYLMAREQNPKVETGRLEIQKASLKLDLSRKELRPNFTVSGGYFLRGGSFDNMYQYQLGLEIPLYSWRKEKLGVEQNVEEVEKSRQTYHTRLQEVTFQIKDNYIGARTSQRLIKLYRGGIIPQATASLDSALSAYEVGSVDFLTLVDNALTILNYEIQYQDEVRDFFHNLVHMEELLGQVFVR